MINQKDELISEYFETGGTFFTVSDIGFIRDSGTTKIISSYFGRSFYIDKNENTLHYRYPTNPESRILDSKLEYYILDRLESFIRRSEERIRVTKLTIDKIKKIDE